MRSRQAAARAKGVQLPVLMARTEDEIDTAFASLGQLQAGGLVVEADAFFNSRREQLLALASRYAVPTIYENRGFTAAGGLSRGEPPAAERRKKSLVTKLISTRSRHESRHPQVWSPFLPSAKALNRSAIAH